MSPCVSGLQGNCGLIVCKVCLQWIGTVKMWAVELKYHDTGGLMTNLSYPPMSSVTNNEIRSREMHSTYNA